MKYFQSQHSHRRYRPYQSVWSRLSRGLKKKKPRITISTANSAFHYRGNPFKRNSRRGCPGYKVAILGLLILTWTSLLLYLPFFNIDEINYSGLKNINRGEINALVESSFLDCHTIIPCKNYFLLDTDAIEKKLLDIYSLNSAVVEKNFPGQLIIDVNEKLSALIYDNGKGYYLLDKGGTVTNFLTEVRPSEFRPISASDHEQQPLDPSSGSSTLDLVNSQATSTTASSTAVEHVPDFRRIRRSYGSYPILYNARAEAVAEKQRGVLPTELIMTVIEWYGSLEQQNIAAVDYFYLDTEPQGIKVYTSQPWNLYFNPKLDTFSQIYNLKTLLKDNKPSSYVDLRYGERVYWK